MTHHKDGYTEKAQQGEPNKGASPIQDLLVTQPEHVPEYCMYIKWLPLPSFLPFSNSGRLTFYEIIIELNL